MNEAEKKAIESLASLMDYLADRNMADSKQMPSIKDYCEGKVSAYQIAGSRIRQFLADLEGAE